MMLWQTCWFPIQKHALPSSYLTEHYIHKNYIQVSTLLQGASAESKSFFPSSNGVITIGLFSHGGPIMFAVVGLDMGMWYNSSKWNKTESLLGDFWKRNTRRNSPSAGCFVSACNASNCCSCLRTIWAKSKGKSQHLRIQSKNQQTTRWEGPGTLLMSLSPLINQLWSHPTSRLLHMGNWFFLLHK